MDGVGGVVLEHIGPKWPPRMVVSRPESRLRGHVRGYAGIRVEADWPLRGRLLPTAGVTLFIDFVTSARLVATPVPAPPLRVLTSHVAGLRDGPVLFEQQSHHFGMAVELTPLGAHALFGVPMRELANVTVDLADLLGHQAGHLTERLAQAPDWPARFTLLDRLLPAWLSAGPAPIPAVQHALLLLRQSAGSMSVGALAERLGVTRRYLEARFGEQVGLPPKTMARIVRFRRAVHLLTAPGEGSLSLIASRCGYADQAHFHRDFRRLAGCTPVQFHAEHLAANTVETLH